MYKILHVLIVSARFSINYSKCMYMIFSIYAKLLGPGGGILEEVA